MGESPTAEDEKERRKVLNKTFQTQRPIAMVQGGQQKLVPQSNREDEFHHRPISH